MKSLYLRIWLTVVAVLALFALTTGWLVQRHLAQERERADAMLAERMTGWGNLIQNALPERQAADADQAAALEEWSRRLRVPLALDDMNGRRIAATEFYRRREQQADAVERKLMIQLDDGRRLWMIRPSLDHVARIEGLAGRGPRDEFRGGPPDGGPGGLRGPGGPGGPRDEFRGGPPGAILDRVPGDLDRRGPPSPNALFGLPRDWSPTAGLVLMLMLQFLAVAAGAFPVVRGLTRRLERLKRGVEAFGAGQLSHRVDVQGRDEVAAVAASFNQAASRIEHLVQSNQSLLANASHELRSPLARLKMAVSMLGDAGPAHAAKLQREIHANIAELDALVEEVLLSSRLEAGARMELNDPVDLLGLVAEEAARVDAAVEGEPVVVQGSDRLLRRAVRNLLENARRYGGDEVSAQVRRLGSHQVEIAVCDRGPGVPESERERIFEPFYRMSGHAEREGGVGLGLALVRQIVERHQGTVSCRERQGGGSCFAIRLPLERAATVTPPASDAGAAPRP